MSKRDQTAKHLTIQATKTTGDVAAVSSEHPLTLRLPEELVRWVDDLVPYVRADLTYSTVGRVSRSQVLRIALLEGVRELRRRYRLEEGQISGGDG